MPARGPDADLLLVNGRVHTMNADDEVVTAVAIRGGRVLATGPDDGARALVAPDAHVIDLGGRTVLPGLIDAHNHMLWAGQMLTEVPLHDCRSVAEIIERVAAQARGAAPGTWIRGRGWDETLLAEQRHPTRHDLDPISPDNPVVIERVFNRLVANSRALEACGIDASTPDFPHNEGLSGYFERDAEGAPTGLFCDAAKGMVLNAIPEPTEEELAEAVARATHAYNAVGLTAVEEPNLSDPELRAYARARRDGSLTVRTDFMLPGWGFLTAIGRPDSDGDALTERLRRQHAFTAGFGDDLWRFTGIKILVDGGVGDYTARMIDPYAGRPDTRGTWGVDPAKLDDMVRFAHERDWSVDAHACGDAAQEAVAEAMARAIADDPRPWLRHRIHHAYFPTPRTLELMAEHGIPAVISSPFLVHRADSYFATVGPELSERIMPARTYLDAGVVVASSADPPTVDWNPWEGIYGLCSRVTVQGRSLDQAERLSVHEALRTYTVAGAYALGREDELGSLEPGKHADVIVLDTDPHDLPLDELRAVRPVATLLGGRFVHGDERVIARVSAAVS